MVNLHSYTVYSDGHIPVADMLKEAQEKKISMLSITDHNTLA